MGSLDPSVGADYCTIAEMQVASRVSLKCLIIRTTIGLTPPPPCPLVAGVRFPPRAARTGWPPMAYLSRRSGPEERPQAPREALRQQVRLARESQHRLSYGSSCLPPCTCPPLKPPVSTHHSSRSSLPSASATLPLPSTLTPARVGGWHEL